MCIRDRLELAGIPYVGCGVLASAVCMDKAVANALFDANSIPHTKWLSATRWEIESDPEGVCDGVIAKLGWPVFVKPANAGSSLSLIHISEPTRRTPISYAVFCLKKKKKNRTNLTLIHIYKIQI